ncbi:MAG: LpqB family beta-propeller domain-containing protein [Blastocatellia bacterium]
MRYVLGKLELHTALRQLSFDGEPIPVSQLAIDILLFLIERNGEVVSKSELLQAVWPEEPANEMRLVKQISLLRQLVERFPSAPSIIVTVSGSGYRTDRWEFRPTSTPTVEAVADAESSRTPPEKESPTNSVPGKRTTQPTAIKWTSRWRSGLRLHWRRAALSMPFVLLLIYVFLSIVSQIEVRYKFGPSGIVKARTNQGFKRNLNISRDGRVLAYYESMEPDGASQLVMVNLTDQSVTPIPGNWNGEEEIAWSPDNRSIALLRFQGDGQTRRQLSISSLDSQQVRTIGEVAAGGIDWAPNGQQIAVCEQITERGLPDSGSIRIQLLAVDRSSRKQVTGNPTRGRVIDSRPRFSPDGSRLAFLRRHLADQSLEIRLVDLAKGEERQLIQEPGKLGEPVEISDLDWSPNSQEVLFLSNRNGRPQLWRVSSDNSAAKPSPDLVTMISDPIHSFSISDRGDLAYVCLPESKSQIDLIPFPEESLDSLFHRRQGPGDVPCTICSSNSTYAPAFSPDGNQIAFLSTQSGAEEIWIANADCTNYRQLTFLNQSGLNRLTWSGDGTRIAFDQQIGGQFDLFHFNLASGRIHRLTDTAGDEFSPIWSRNSGAIYYTWQSKGVERGTLQVRRLDLATGQTDLLVEEGGGRLALSLNEEQLYFTQQDQIWRKNLQTGEEQRLAQLEEITRQASWEINRDNIYLIRREDPAMPALFWSDLRSGRMERVVELDTPVSKSSPSFAISPNGRALAITSISPSSKEIRFLKYSE